MHGGLHYGNINDGNTLATSPFETLYPDRVDMLLTTYREYNSVMHSHHRGGGFLPCCFYNGLQRKKPQYSFYLYVYAFMSISEFQTENKIANCKNNQHQT